MFALHLVQNAFYINTLMLQKVQAQPQPHWHEADGPDYTALAPLIWEHVNPYGSIST